MLVVPSERTKNDKPNRVPLSPLALQIAREAMAVAGKDAVWLFPSPKLEAVTNANGTVEHVSRPIGAHAATRSMERIRPTLGLPDFRVHDLRRTAASRMAEMGINPHTTGIVLGHASASKGTVTLAHYVEYSFDREKREALNAWSVRLSQIVVGQTGANVVPISKATI